MNEGSAYKRGIVGNAGVGLTVPALVASNDEIRVSSGRKTGFRAKLVQLPPCARQGALRTNLLIAKHRNGPTGEVPLTFLKGYTRFESAALWRLGMSW